MIIHTFAAESIALFVLFMMWLVGTGIATVGPFFFISLTRTLTQKRIVDVGKLGVVPSVFAMPTPQCTRGDCVDRLGHFVLPSRR
jgi:cellobiose-specific phosphotransferase system component IIC